MKKNRVLAVIMAVLMMVTLLPSMVFAASAPQGALDGKLNNCSRRYLKRRLFQGKTRRNYR